MRNYFTPYVSGICGYCKKENILKFGFRKYCSKKCCDKARYNYGKEKYIDNARNWELKNPEKAREIHNKSSIKFRKNKRGRLNELMLMQYIKHKERWHDRGYVSRNKKRFEDKLGVKCILCGENYAEFHHKRYGLKVLWEIENPQIDYFDFHCKYVIPLCKKCHLAQ